MWSYHRPSEVNKLKYPLWIALSHRIRDLMLGNEDQNMYPPEIKRDWKTDTSIGDNTNHVNEPFKYGVKKDCSQPFYENTINLQETDKFRCLACNDYLETIQSASWLAGDLQVQQFFNSHSFSVTA